MEPSIFDGAEEMYCTAPNRVSVLGATKRHRQIADVLRLLRAKYPRNISLCCKGIESAAWGFPTAESQRVLTFLSARPQTIKFFDVDDCGLPEEVGSMSGEYWSNIYKSQPKWQLSGQYKISRADLEVKL